jgi:hypothetical protein
VCKCSSENQILDKSLNDHERKVFYECGITSHKWADKKLQEIENEKLNLRELYYQL